MADSLTGVVERITYYNEENGYSVVRLAPSGTMPFWSGLSDDGLVTVVGSLLDVTPGESLEVEGEWRTHPRHGRQFQAETVRRIMPASVEGMRRYLGSGMIKGVGPKTAKRIVEAFGAETFDVLDADPQKLYEVEGVGRHRAGLIVDGWARQRRIKDVMIFLQGYGISTTLATRIYNEYGDDAVARVKDDPYRLARDIYGIGFKTADKIARAMGLAADDPRRLEAGVIYALAEAGDDGHVYQPEEALIETAAGLLDVEIGQMPEAVSRAVEAELARREAVPVGEGEVQAVYLPVAHAIETGIARLVARLIEEPGSHLAGLRDLNLPMLVAEGAAQADAPLSAQQEEAVRSALENKITVLTGGPGTGKTTAMRALIYALQAAGRSFALMSPTGRAAKRLSEATREPASTIHRRLGYTPARGFSHDENNPLPVDMVIVDEASMLDAGLAYSLLKAVDPRSHLLLVGDVDQLPSVGAGDVLRDLIDSGQMPVTRLAVIFRQSAESLIISNAHRVNKGEMPRFPEAAEDFFLFSVPEDIERVADLVVEIVKDRIPRRFGLNALDDVQVLVPMYRGPAGVQALNMRLQAALNPPGRPAERVLAGRLFRMGDKVMQTRNNYDKEVFNGDIGRVHSLNAMDQTMTMVFDERFVTYDFSETPELTHAYAISVHRSQGSEYPAVVVPVVTQHFMMLQRNLLYTAITRAKRLVVLVGSKKAIWVAANNDQVSRRYTALAARLRGEIS